MRIVNSLAEEIEVKYIKKGGGQSSKNIQPHSEDTIDPKSRTKVNIVISDQHEGEDKFPKDSHPDIEIKDPGA